MRKKVQVMAQRRQDVEVLPDPVSFPHNILCLHTLICLLTHIINLTYLYTCLFMFLAGVLLS